MQIQKIIEQLGYKPNEAKVYLAALGLGECHVSDIAMKVKLPRSSVQVIVDKLHKDGLMNFYVKRRYKYWVAEHPERLLSQLQRREESVRSALPALSALRKDGKEAGKAEVKVFTGRDEIKFIFDDIVETRHHVQAIIPQDDFLRLFEGTSIWTDFVAARVRGNLRLRVLAPDTEAGRALMKDAGSSLREVRLLPQHFGVQTVLYIYGDKIASIMFNRKEATGLIIEDPGMRETNAALFEQLWERSEAQAARRQESSSDVFRLLADSSPQPLLIANERAEIEYVNAAWERQFGYTLAEVRGKHTRLLQSGKTPPHVYERMWKQLEAGKPFRSDEVVDKRKDGTCFNLMTTLFPLKSGDTLRFVQILDDVTKRKRAEDLRKKFLQQAHWDVNPPLAKLHFLRGVLRKSREKRLKKSADDLAAVENELLRLDRLTRKLIE